MAFQNSINYDKEEEYSIMIGDLSKDVVVQILFRLPVRDLLRFRSVCKSWYNFLKSPNFIKLHTAHQISRPASTIIAYNYKRGNHTCVWPNLFLLHLNPVICNIEQDNFTINDQLPLPFTDDAADYVDFAFCYNGLIGLIKDMYTSPVVIIWNPAIRRYKYINIPSECSKFTYLKLGYHQQSNDYKILRVPFCADDKLSKMAWVYTLSSGSWKSVPFTLLSRTLSLGFQVSLNGFMYWLASHREASRTKTYIICFDLIKDEFKLLDVPDDRGFNLQIIYRRLIGLRGSLAMTVSIDDGSWDTEIWTLVNRSSSLQPYSWTKKFIIEPFSKTIPLGMWDADKLFVKVLKADHALKQVYFSYDLVTKEMNYFHVPKKQRLASLTTHHGRYFESLELEDGFDQRY